jgi:hypothetical protein
MMNKFVCGQLLEDVVHAEGARVRRLEQVNDDEYILGLNFLQKLVIVHVVTNAKFLCTDG